MARNQFLPSSASWVEQPEPLLELLPLDTAYADLYLGRACQLATAGLSPDLDLEQQARDALASGSFAARIEATVASPTAASSDQTVPEIEPTPLLTRFAIVDWRRLRAW